MYLVKKVFTFEYAHVLPWHDGKCAREHGHSGKLEILVRGEQLNEVGPKTNMLIDFGDIKKIVQPIVDQYLDHHRLNDSLDIESPTSEAIAKWIYDKVKPLIPQLWGVKVCETCTSEALYYEVTDVLVHKVLNG